MGLLIDDLLELSRLTRGSINVEHTNLSELAHGIVKELKRQQPERQVEFSIMPDIMANCDTALMKVVLENLLENAWKFTHKQESASIQFGVTEGSTPAYFVRDDGIGFDTAYCEKLFGAFQRLHSNDEFPGSGIGLATVQRIVTRHGGRIWADGEVDKGAVFYFVVKSV